MKKNNLPLIILIVLFFGPLILAGAMYLARPTFLNKTTNRAVLLQPTQDIAQLTLYTNNGAVLSKPPAQGKWILLYVASLPCEQICQENIFKIRQTYLSFLDKDRHRLARVWLTFTPLKDPKLISALLTHYEGTQQFVVKQAQLRKILPQGELFIIDPHGNILLSYAADAKPKDILKDLTKLLKVSQIG